MSIHHCNPQTETKRPHARGFGPGRRHAANRERWHRVGRLEGKDKLGDRVRSTPPSRRRSGLQDRPDVPDRPSTTCAAVPSVCAASSSSSKPPKLIRSQNNPKVKHCVKLLQSKKYRDEQQKVMLCGRTLLEEIGPYMPDIDSVFYIGSEHVDVLDYANDPYLHVDSPFVRELLSTSTATYNVTKQIMGKLCNVTTVGDSHVAAEVDLPTFQDFRAYAPGTVTRLLVLERCQDPGNMGTLLRSCVAFGFDGVFLLPGCADPFNDKTVRASRGAGWRVPMMQGGIEAWEAVVDRHGLVAVAADVAEREDGDGGGDVGGDLRGGELEALAGARVSLVVGSEGQGLSEAMRGKCRLVSIPMSDEMESLNVAMAASIIMCLLSSSAGRLVASLARVLPASS